DVWSFVLRNVRWVVCHFAGFAGICSFRRNELVSRIRFCCTTITIDFFDHALSFVEGWLDAPKTATSKDCCPCLLWRRILPVTAADSDRRKRCAAEREKKDSLHTVDLRHHANRRVVNNSDSFCLPSTAATVISGSTLTDGGCRSG